MKPDQHWNHANTPRYANNKNEAGKIACHQEEAMRVRERMNKKNSRVFSPQCVVITNHVTMLTLYLYMCVLPPICVCFMRTVTMYTSPMNSSNRVVWHRENVHGEIKRTYFHAQSAVSTNQTINQSFNQSSGKKMCLNGFTFCFPFCHTLSLTCCYLLPSPFSCRYWTKLESASETGLFDFFLNPISIANFI